MARGHWQKGPGGVQSQLFVLWDVLRATNCVLQTIFTEFGHYIKEGVVVDPSHKKVCDLTTGMPVGATE